MHEFPKPINAFIAWCTDQGPKKAGLPVGSFEQLRIEAAATLNTLTVTGHALYALRDVWTNTVTEGASPPQAAVLLATMNEASSRLDVLQAQAGKLQSALQPVLPIVSRKRQEITAGLTDTRNRLNQAQAEKQRLDARIAETKRKLAAGEGNTHDLQQQLTRDSFMTINNDILNLQFGYTNQEQLQGQLAVCNDLSTALDSLRSSLASSRNLMNAADEPMNSSIRAETKVLGTSRKGVAAYYKREVGREMEDLIATFSG